MKVIIRKKTYDTDVDTKLGAKSFGEFGQADGYEEQLFVTADGGHFLYGIGGPSSPYAEPQINSLSKVKAEAWKKENMA
ncbi:MAG: hypothetical protein FWB96_10985 [Defluviitaleaceae bacterium]|nr:hypothetical protein [Defluviitaleaceae bacterium]MCL2263487.1 hypothetical protein [Defluviitaleaceae bacterium]